ncbi:glycosyltransferase family A protein [Paraflavisolibacter sp. H34]|uniref:glycosyltransferase family 2 protein n=1 Tax=Huijunlia imazamoxiresistens TaxID=3127457 RepID=UPI0030170317
MSVLVSVIVPTYNRADKIIKCLESLAGQTYSSLEIIVVDDGSVDDTRQVIEGFVKERSLEGILFYYRQANQGAPVARNLGLKKARGSYVVFFDSDDMMFPDRIRKQVEAMNREKSDCSACGFVHSSNEEVFIPEVDAEKGYIGSLIYWKLMGSTQCWMYKKEILEKIGGYDPSYACYQDWDLTFRYLTYARKIALVKESLSIFHNDERKDRITSQVQAEKRIPHIQRFHIKVIDWLLQEKQDAKLLNHMLFNYVHQVTLPYYKGGMKAKAKESYSSLAQVVKQKSLSKAFSLRFVFFKHLIKEMV